VTLRDLSSIGRSAREIVVIALWACNVPGQTPRFVTAWAEAVDGMCHESAHLLRSEAEDRLRSDSDEQNWRFWTTTESIARPEAA
jgi:hypothetical protein